MTGAACALAACEPEVAISLYTSDVQAVLETGTDMTATAVLSIPASTEEKCAELGPTVLKAVAKGFDAPEFIGCRKADLETFAEFRIAIPIRRLPTDVTTALTLLVGDQNGGPAVALDQHPPKVDAIVSALPDEIRYLINGPLNAQISANVQNDGAGPASIRVQGVFLDGQPYQLEHVATIERRGEALIRLSDVGNAGLHFGGALIYFIQP